MTPFRSRRFALLTGLAATATVLAAPLRAATRTPRAAEGPFYPTPGMRFADADNDLVRIKGKAGTAKGEIVTVRGRVVDSEGRPVAGARVEIWQCDANGRYLHQGDDRSVARDPYFQGFGYVVTDASGEWAFRTIKPVIYPGRAPHIHAKIIAGGRTLTTQLYIAGHPQNRRDWLYNRMSRAERQAVSMAFRRRGRTQEAVLDLVV